ncbi:amino acid adenylation domain-containing protein, partial [Rugamonas sp. CCM 8940]
GAALSRQFFDTPFDLAHGPLIRGLLLRLDADQHMLLIDQHHIISDGWSLGVLVREVSALYTAFSQGQDDPLAPLAIQYADYAVWQRAWLQGDALQAQLDYWKGRLADAPELLALPSDFPRPEVQDHAGASVDFALSAELTGGLKQLSQRHGSTLFMTLLAGWGILMARLSGQSDVVIGSPIANRQRAQAENLIGFFANTLALRVDIGADPSVAALLARVRLDTLDAYVYQDLPFEQVVDAVKPQRSMRHSPLFQTMFTFNNTPGGDGYGLPGLTLSGVATPHTTAQFDLSLSMSEAEQTLVGGLVYATALFKSDTVDRLLGYFRTLLQAMVENDQQNVSRLQLLAADQREQLTGGFNATATAAPGTQLVHQLFEQQAARTPRSVALSFEGETLTYAELNKRANRLAHRLVAMGVGPDERVAICAPRGTTMVVGLLAVLKAGGAYVPLDPAYPAERLAYMLGDSGPKVLLTERRLHTHLAGTTPVLHLDELDELDALDALAAQATHNPQRADLAPSHLAYLIYTSGSTGQPKGVMVPHAAVCNYLDWAYGHYQSTGACHAIVSSPLAFDATVTSVYLPLMSGGSLHLIPEGEELEGLEALFASSNGALVKITPAHLALLGQRLQATGRRYPAHVFVVGGEALPAATAALWRTLSPSSRIINEYGPTETVVGCITYEVDAGLGGREFVPIGRPIANTQIHIVDAGMQPVPLGVVGEIYIGGAGVTRGYLNRPELTAERFLLNPFGAGQLYKTGDLGRWLDDGNIDYLGRNDFQVKIRGYRIELGEIEARLAQCDGVREAVVLAREDQPGDKRLVAYLSGEPGSPAELRAELGRHLAEYMLPAAFVTLDSMPLTANGKLDRKALPAPDMTAMATHSYAAPQGELEQAIAAIWQTLLGVERVGRHDDFFALGGHSLLAVRLMSRLNQALDVDIALRTLFSQPTLAGFAGLVAEQALQANCSNMVAIRTTGGEAPLFLIHPGLGEIAYAYELAKWIDPQVPVYGLAASGFLKGEVAKSTVEEMARDYVRGIRRVQPKGPYRIAGWSSGGMIAYEIANQLIGADDSVQFLGLLDTTSDYRYGPGATPPTQDVASYLFEAVRDNLARYAVNELRQLHAEGDVPAMLQLCQDKGILPAGIDNETLQRHLAVRYGMAIAMANYALPAVSVPITLFSAQDEKRRDRQLGWGEIAGVRLTTHAVPGGHYSMVEAPHVQALGAALSSALSQATPLKHPEHAYLPRLTIQRGQAGQLPLYCVPGAGASITSFTHLAMALGAELPVHGLQPRGLCGELAPHSSVASAASFYLQTLREHNPQGPVHLLGHSYGGWIVREMAQQLAAQGQAPASVFVLDSRVPSLAENRSNYTRVEILERLVHLFELNLPRPLGLQAADFALLEPERQLNLLLSRLIDVKILPPRTSLQTMKGIVRVFGSNLNTPYAPASYPHPLHLVVAPDADSDSAYVARDPASVLAGWRGNAPQTQLWQAPGNHLTLLAPDHVGALAAWMRPILLDAQHHALAAQKA